MNLPDPISTTPKFVFPSASASSSALDFNFLQGSWQVKNRKLKQRLAHCQDWEEFDARITLQPTLLGQANVERYFAQFGDRPFEGMAVRLFNPSTRLWRIYWIDSNNPQMDEHPVEGCFTDSVGRFYALGEFNGQAIVMLYQWDARDPARPIWSQAFSPDEGHSWEWNWSMHLTRES